MATRGGAAAAGNDAHSSASKAEKHLIIAKTMTGRTPDVDP
jgi:hypothetical protein